MGYFECTGLDLGKYPVLHYDLEKHPASHFKKILSAYFPRARVVLAPNLSLGIILL
jgi:hypothetical protein